MIEDLSKNDFDIKQKEHYKLYVLLKDQITFESELIKKGIRYYSEINEQPSIDGGIRYFFLDSDMENIDKIIKSNEIVANIETNLVSDFQDEKKVVKLYVSILIGVIVITILVGVISKLFG